MVYSRKRLSGRGGGGGREGGGGEDMKFPGVYWKNSKWNLQGFIQKVVEFAGVIKKRSCGISIGLGFLGLKVSKGCSTILWSL